MNKKIDYVTLVSDLYLLLALSWALYGIFFSFERIGISSFTVMTIDKNGYIIMAITEIILSLLMSYLLHKCDHGRVRIMLMMICVLNIIYRIINILAMVNPFILLMILVNIILFIVLIFY